jgi:hypothetical protein
MSIFDLFLVMFHHVRKQKSKGLLQKDTSGEGIRLLNVADHLGQRRLLECPLRLLSLLRLEAIYTFPLRSMDEIVEIR